MIVNGQHHETKQQPTIQIVHRLLFILASQFRVNQITPVQTIERIGSSQHRTSK